MVFMSKLVWNPRYEYLWNLDFLVERIWKKNTIQNSLLGLLNWKMDYSVNNTVHLKKQILNYSGKLLISFRKFLTVCNYAKYDKKMTISRRLHSSFFCVLTVCHQIFCPYYDSYESIMIWCNVRTSRHFYICFLVSIIHIFC